MSITVKDLHDDLLTMDIEVFRYYWSVSVKFYGKEEWVKFNSTEGDGQGFAPNLKLKKLMEEREWVVIGANIKGYDQHILKAITMCYDHETIKELNDFIINDSDEYIPPWKWAKYPRAGVDIYMADVQDDLQERMSLKMYEGNKGMVIKESDVPFDLDRPLTQEEIDQNEKYNDHDVSATEMQFNDREDYFNTKLMLAEMSGVNPKQAMGMTNAKLVGSYLCTIKKPNLTRTDGFDYVIPEEVNVKNPTVIAYFKNIHQYTKLLDIEISGCPHTLGAGGLHGALPNYIDESDDEWLIILADGDQYYPSIIVEYNYQSRSMSSPQLYTESKQMRSKFKAENNPKQAPFKLVNNTTYGAMNDKYNVLYDPLMANSTCFTGQLLLIDLIERLTEALGEDFVLIQSNTDGVMFKFRKSRQTDVDSLLKKWEQRTHIDLDIDVIKKVAQRDVNNYIMMKDNGKIKAKGGHLKAYGGSSWEDGHLPIVAKAIGDYFMFGTLPETTINSCYNILEFQMLLRYGRKYMYGEQTINGEVHKLQKVNRVYATKDKGYGALYKVKMEKGELKKGKIAGTPTYARVDNDNKMSILELDKQFYIDLARERIIRIIGKGGATNMSDKIGKIANRMTYMSMNGEIKQFKKGDNIPPEWLDADVITRKRYLELEENGGLEKMPKEEIETVDLTDEETVTSIDEPKEVELVAHQGVSPSDRVAFYKKRAELRRVLYNMNWDKDGYNTNQSYEFITGAKAKQNLTLALMKVGMEMEVYATDNKFTMNVGKMHMSELTTLVTLVDIDTGYSVDYKMITQGADTGDKGINKAYTAVCKYFVFNQFGIGERDDAEFEEVESKSTSKSKAPTSGLAEPKSEWVSDEKKEEIRQDVAKDETPASEENVTVFRGIVKDLKARGGHDEFVTKAVEIMKNNPTDSQVTNLILEAEMLNA